MDPLAFDQSLHLPRKICSLQDIQTYNGGMFDLREIH